MLPVHATHDAFVWIYEDVKAVCWGELQRATNIFHTHTYTYINQSFSLLCACVCLPFPFLFFFFVSFSLLSLFLSLSLSPSLSIPLLSPIISHSLHFLHPSSFAFIHHSFVPPPHSSSIASSTHIAHVLLHISTHHRAFTPCLPPLLYF